MRARFRASGSKSSIMGYWRNCVNSRFWGELKLCWGTYCARQLCCPGEDGHQSEVQILKVSIDERAGAYNPAIILVGDIGDMPLISGDSLGSIRDFHL